MEDPRKFDDDTVSDIIILFQVRYHSWYMKGELPVCVWSIKQKNTQYYAVGRNSGGRAQATHTYGARPMESRKLMTAAACITEVASANTMAEDMAARWCARYVLGDVLDVP